ncbi:MAG TPA: dihydrofolate reductase family protein [Gammaproteobacteria bacterium]|nr:dihydrofolate reductase family protein [Gammaproteobacteria bacterium]
MARRLINSTFITLDGAVGNPHLWPSLGGAASQLSLEIQMELIEACDAVLMGRRTYESFAAAWPTRSGDPYSDRINAIRKYVASTTLRDPAWNNTVVIGGDFAEEVRRIKQQPGKDIVQYGFGSVSFALMERGLIDELRLWVHPLILGRNGPKEPHFLACPASRLEPLTSRTLPNGIVVLAYRVVKQAD